MEYDIALVKIEKVEFTSHIQPISLPKALVCDDQDRKRKKSGKRKRKRKKKRKRRRKRIKGKRKQRSKKKKTKRKVRKKGKGKWAKEEALIDDMTQVIKELKKKMMEDIEEMEETAEEDGSGSGFGSGDGFDQGWDGGDGDSGVCNIKKEQKKRKTWYASNSHKLCFIKISSLNTSDSSSTSWNDSYFPPASLRILTEIQIQSWLGRLQLSLGDL